MSMARLVITAVTVEGRSKSEVARDYGVSRVWVQKLVRRYQREGPAAFEPRSRRPHSNPRAVDLEVEDHIVRLRKTLTKKGVDAGAETIAAHLQMAGVSPVPAVSTIWRILSRRGFVVGQPQKRPRSSWRTFCAEQPNERWQADITHWRLADGSEVEILNILDDHSRLCLATDARPHHHRAAGGRHVPHRVRSVGDAGQCVDRQWGRLHRETARRGPGGARDPARPGRNPARPFPPLPSADLREGGAVPPNPEEVAGRATEGCDRGRAATPAGPVRALLQHRSAHRALGRRTPAQAYAGRPKAVPTGPVIPAHYRVRTDKIDAGGSVTVRHNSRLHHIGLGARLAGTPISLLIDDLHIRVIHRHTGQLIRELILDPTRDYQPRGLPPDHPNATRAATPPAASRSRPKVPPAAGVKAGRRPPEGPRP
jgi:transposase